MATPHYEALWMTARERAEAAEARVRELEDALRRAADDVIWMSGIGPIPPGTYWEIIRDEHLPAWGALLASSPSREETPG